MVLTAIVVGVIIWLLVVDEDMRTIFLHWFEVTFLLGIAAAIIWVIWGSPKGE
jgi:hypothetical protein